MSETVDVKTGEVVEETALAKPSDLSMMVKEQDRPVMEMMSKASLNWKELQPNQMAVLLMQKPFSVSGGGILYLNFKQALYFAVRCFELGVSPFSSEVWFDPQKFSVNLTLEGKRQVARNTGVDLGPPQFEEVVREWSEVAKITESGEAARKDGFNKDLGCKCTIRVGPVANKETVSYTAWINDWYVSRSPVWKAKPSHMLAIRANEKAVTLALGTGVSAMPDEREAPDDGA